MAGDPGGLLNAVVPWSWEGRLATPFLDGVLDGIGVDWPSRDASVLGRSVEAGIDVAEDALETFESSAGGGLAF